MSARPNDLARIQEVFNVATQTQKQVKELGFTKRRFINPSTVEDDLIAEGIMNRVFRITEEVGRIDGAIAQEYEFDTHGASGVRNRLAHAYLEVDREIVWDVVKTEIPVLIEACKKYCDDNGIDIE